MARFRVVAILSHTGYIIKIRPYIYEGVITVSMESETQTDYILNSPIAEQTITLNDANYSGLKIPSAELNFEEVD